MNPQLGPRPRSDIYALTDYTEVIHLRHTLGCDLWACYAEVEEYGSAIELAAARDLEEWGCNPFEEN